MRQSVLGMGWSALPHLWDEPPLPLGVHDGLLSDEGITAQAAAAAFEPECLWRVTHVPSDVHDQIGQDIPRQLRGPAHVHAIDMLTWHFPGQAA